MISTINLGDKFDDYVRAARIYPALITLAPVFLASLAIINGLVLNILWPLLVSLGFVYLLGHLARSLGKRLEVALVREWGGLATTKLLRYSEAENNVLLNRRHEQLAAFSGIVMPNEPAESSDPAAADDTYIAAIKLLSSYARERQGQFPRVHEEVVSYGFRRNLLALKSLALTLIVVATTLESTVCLIDHTSTLRISCIVLQLALGLFWLIIVNPSWVYQSAVQYAERLFDALNEISTTGSVGK